MEIKISELRRFEKLSSHTKSAGILPIYRYLKFEPGKIIRVVGGAFTQMKCDGIDDVILVEESALSSLINSTRETITITKDKKKVYITDGVVKNYHPIVDTDEYSPIPEPESEVYAISDDFLEGLGMAGSVAKAMESTPININYVHIGNLSICGGDGFMGIYYPIEEDVCMVIEKKTALFLSKLNLHSYRSSDKYHFFYDNVGSCLGFSKQIIGYRELRKVLQYKPDVKVAFTASKSDITSFNSIAMQLSRGCDVNILEQKIYWSDPGTSCGSESENKCFTVKEEFTYNPSRMNAVLEALGASELDFHDGSGLYYITSSETKANAIIAKIKKL